jgi:serine O-acetyltransferase
MRLIKDIKFDIQAIFDHDPAVKSVLEILFAYPGFHARQWHRLAHTLYQWHVPLFPRFISHISRFLTGIEIHPAVEIGKALFIDHGMGVVIGETSQIGDNVVIYQGVTLGGTSLQKKKRHPTLGNSVVIGAGAKLIGAIKIGDNSKVGAGSVVVTSVPANATVVGVPGRVVEIRNPDTDIVEKLPDPVWEKIEGLEKRITELEKLLSDEQGNNKMIPKHSGRSSK